MIRLGAGDDYVTLCSPLPLPAYPSARECKARAVSLLVLCRGACGGTDAWVPGAQTVAERLVAACTAAVDVCVTVCHSVHVVIMTHDT